jgi:hypothetical protein
MLAGDGDSWLSTDDRGGFVNIVTNGAQCHRSFGCQVLSAGETIQLIVGDRIKPGRTRQPRKPELEEPHEKPKLAMRPIN